MASATERTMTHPSPTALEEIRKRHEADSAPANRTREQYFDAAIKCFEDRGTLLTHIAALEAELAEAKRFASAVGLTRRNLIERAEKAEALLSGAATAEQRPTELDELLNRAVAAFNAMSPEEQAKHRQAQRESWIRGEMGLGPENGTTGAATPAPTLQENVIAERPFSYLDSTHMKGPQAPTAALTEAAPTTTEEGPKPKYGEFYAADLPEEQQYQKAAQLVIKEQKASTSFIQRHLQIGYNRAARLLERMAVEGICTEPNGVGMRTVLAKSPPQGAEE